MKKLFCLLSVCFLLNACSSSRTQRAAPTSSLEATKAPAQSLAPAISSGGSAGEAAPSANGFCLEGNEGLPAALGDYLVTSNRQNCKADSGKFIFTFKKTGEKPVAVWRYALVAAFPTLLSELPENDLRSFWQTGASSALKNLAMTEETFALFEQSWGKAAFTPVIKVEEQLQDWAWQNGEGHLALIPFETLGPRWKLIIVHPSADGKPDTDPFRLPIEVPIYLSALSGFVAEEAISDLPETNFDPEKLTSVVMTGTTALSRATAWGMDQQGVLAPAKNIGDFLKGANILHISNEASFTPDCPAPGNEHLSLLLCSADKNLDLLKFIGTDVVELTGDHLLDFGDAPFLHTLSLYQEAGIQTFGGGADSTEASQPALFNVKGNKIAFLGCNGKHVGYPVASSNQPGPLDCDLEALLKRIKGLRAEGYLPIVTFQHMELSYWYPIVRMSREFAQAAAAGAVIVSGSQAHRPQTFAFGGQDGKSFMHYGLGNLFFDQYEMGEDYDKGFVDQHLFCEGRYMGTILHVLNFPDSVSPQWADPAARDQLLQMFYLTSGLVRTPW